MIINNKELATRIKFGYSIFFMVFLFLLVASLILTFLPNYLFEIILSVLSLSAFAIYLMIGYNYIYFSTEGDKVILRYQTLNPFIENPKSIEIDKSTFVKHEIINSFLGLKESVVLYQKSLKGIAKYPPVGINSLKKSEKEAMLKTLTSLTK